MKYTSMIFSAAMALAMAACSSGPEIDNDNVTKDLNQNGSQLQLEPMALLTANPSSVRFRDTVVHPSQNEAPDQVIILRNEQPQGGYAIRLLGERIPEVFQSRDPSMLCDNPLPPQGECEIPTSFFPYWTSEYRDDLEVKFQVVGSEELRTLKVPLSGNGVRPMIGYRLASPSGRVLNFGDIPAGRDRERTFPIAILGPEAELQVVGRRIESPFTFSGPAPSASWRANQIMNMGIRFSPRAIAGFTSFLDIDFRIPQNEDPLSVSMVASGLSSVINDDLLWVSSGELIDFGRVRAMSVNRVSVTLRNDHSAPVLMNSLESLFSGIQHPFRVENPEGCSGLTLNFGEQCTFTVGFEPMKVGPYESELMVHFRRNDERRAVLIDLKGSAIKKAVVREEDEKL
jgi:hypothetical protein